MPLLHTMSIIEVSGLHKTFKTLPAISDIRFSVDQGELFGLIGPDGAGKTTLLRLLAGVLRPDAGSIHMCGIDVVAQPEAIKDKIGVVPQNFSLYPDLTVAENLDFFAEMYHVGKTASRERRERLLEVTKLAPFLDRRAENLSGGMQKKLALISSLLHTPQVLLLDEPTTGIDPISRRELWDFFYELLASGTTILVSTPYMDEAERCSKVGFLYQAKLLLMDAPDKLQGDYQQSILEITGPDTIRISEQVFPTDLKIADLYAFGDTLHLVSERDTALQVEQFLKTSDWDITVKRIQPRFEDVFVSVIKREHAQH
jgi:ABC-2 type transport system ATP-binding protein